MEETNDRQFFEDFVHRYTGRALAYCRTRLGADDAEEVVQDVMVKLFSRVERLRAMEEPLPYLYRALRNALVDRLRSHKGRVQLDDVTAQGLAAKPVEAHEAKNELSLARAMEGLPEDLRELLELRYFEEMSVEQVAEVLEISAAATAMRLARARVKLKDELARLGVKSLDM